jgi:hypothetical protein
MAMNNAKRNVLLLLLEALLVAQGKGLLAFDPVAQAAK